MIYLRANNHTRDHLMQPAIVDLYIALRAFFSCARESNMQTGCGKKWLLGGTISKPHEVMMTTYERHCYGIEGQVVAAIRCTSLWDELAQKYTCQEFEYWEKDKDFEKLQSHMNGYVQVSVRKDEL